MMIGFSFNKKNILSKLIAWYTESKWSHCFIVYSKIEDDYLILEASYSGGVKFNLLSKYTDVSHDVELISVTDTPLTNILPLMGHNYGSLQILGHFLSKILGLKVNPLTKDLVCSEFVLLLLRDSTIKNRFDHLDLQLVTPQEIYEVLKNG